MGGRGKASPVLFHKFEKLKFPGERNGDSSNSAVDQSHFLDVSS